MTRLSLWCSLVLLAACGRGGDEMAAGDAAEDGSAGAHVAATAEEHAGDRPDPSPATSAAPDVPVLSQEFAYGSAADHNLVGFFAMPEDVTEPLPGVIMVHEWWGLNDNVRAMARQLAGEGYAVLAVDLYAGATATEASGAEQLMTAVMRDREGTLDNIRQAHGYLQQYALAPRIGVLGWCLGGGWALDAGIALGDRVDAIVMYYGQVVTDPSRLQALNAPLLGHFAELDESIPVRSVQTFRARLRELDKPADVFIYSDVAHAFANPSGGAYDAAAAEEAWARTLEFLSANLSSSL